jgi:hypothetical protein
MSQNYVWPSKCSAGSCNDVDGRGAHHWCALFRRDPHGGVPGRVNWAHCGVVLGLCRTGFRCEWQSSGRRLRSIRALRDRCQCLPWMTRLCDEITSSSMVSDTSVIAVRCPWRHRRRRWAYPTIEQHRCTALWKWKPDR